MDIEDLTKSQIVLLVLLVSFVTSIATGIVTVSLLAQAPPAVTQTVNRIVERTIETVVPGETQERSVITTETTVVVKEDDLVTESIQGAFGRIGRVHEGTATSSAPVALATLVTGGALVTDLSLVSERHMVSFPSGSFLYTVSQRYPTIGIAVLTPVEGRPDVPALRVGDTGSLKLGQTTIALFGLHTNRVSINSFSALSRLAEVRVGETTTLVRVLDTSPEVTLTAGAPLINIFGELIGISTSVSRTQGGRSSFVSYSDIVSLIVSRPAPTSPAQ